MTAGRASGVRLPSAAVLAFSKEKPVSFYILEKLLSTTVCGTEIRNHIYHKIFFKEGERLMVSEKQHNMNCLTSGKEHKISCNVRKIFHFPYGFFFLTFR